MNRGSRADDFYTRWARLYDHLSSRTPGIGRLREETVSRLSPRVGGVVVEMGCGPGPNFPYLREAVGASGTVLGLDVARGALDRAQARVERREWDNVHPIRGDATRPPVESPDAILATFVVGMFADPVETVERWCDLVGEGGRVGLLHFARSERWHAPVSNCGLDLLVLASTPGRIRMRRAPSKPLDRRTRAAHDALVARCEDPETSTHWGGLIHLQVGTVGKS